MEAHHHQPFPSSMPSAPDSHDERPSFTNYWRKLNREDSVTVPSARTITFVQSNPSQRASSKTASSTSPKSSSPKSASSPPSHQVDSPPSSSDSAERTTKRRAQVRRAQIQHRQRKANYVKQLEADIADMREQIAGAERERRGLKAENQSIRAHFAHQSTSPASMSGSPHAGATSDDFSHYYEQQQLQPHHEQIDTALYPLGSPSSLSMEQDMFSSLYPAAAVAQHHHISLQKQEDVFIQRDDYLGGSDNGHDRFQLGLDLDLETPHAIDNEIVFFNAPVSGGGLYDVLATPMATTTAANYYEQTSSAPPLSLPTADAYYGFASASLSPLSQQQFTNRRRTGTSTPTSYLHSPVFEGAEQW